MPSFIIVDQFAELESEALAKGYSLSDIIAHLHDIIFQLELPSDVSH